MKLSIFHKFLLLIAIIIVPLAGYSVYHYFEMVEDERAHINEDNLRLSRSVASHIDSIAENTFSLLRGLSVHPAVLSLNSSQCDRVVNGLLKDYPLYLNILGARMDGWNFCSAVPDPEFRRLNYKDKEWFQKGIMGRPHAGDVHISKYFKKPAVMFTMPVFDSSKKQIALLGISLNLEILQKRFKELFSGNDTEIIVLDRKGEVIINTKNPGKTVGINLLQEEGTFTAKGPDGIERLYSFTTSKHGWKVIAGIPLSHAYHHAMAMSRRYLSMIFLFGIIGVLTSIYFAFRLRNSFRHLLEGIAGLEKGDYATRVSPGGGKEMERLADAFNNMAERLNTLHNDLSEKERFYRSLIEHSSDMVIMADRKGVILYASPSVQMLGYTPEEVSERSIFDFIDPVYAPEVRRYMDEALKNPENIYSTVLRVFHKNGSLRMLSAKGRYLKERDSLIINCMDITEDIKREGLLNDILSSISEGFLILDRDFKIISANKAYLDKMKTDLLKIKGKYCWEVSHRTKEPCYLLGEVCPVKETIKTGEPAIAVHTHYSETGEPFYVEIRSYPIKDLSGNVINVIESINDLTEQKRLEQQLRQAQKMEAIGQLAGGVAHDFNNILTAVTGYSSLLQMKLPEDSPLKEYVTEIEKAAERGANLAKGLLAFSRKQPGNPQPVDLNDIVRMIIKLLSKLIREDIELQMQLSKEELIIMADAGHIEQILMNLATNARDAMPEGGVLTIKTELVYIDEKFRDIHGYGKPGEYAMVSVSDTGIGMDENIKSHIFEPFFTTKEVGKGTGLGLAIVYGLVKQYNGYINVYSEPGKGSTFKIYLPIYRAEEKAELLQRKQIVFTKGLGETVLLVDDDAGVRESIRNVLEFAGYKVIEASDGIEALEIYKNKMDEISLIITDLIMPRMNGKVLYDKIMELNPSQRIVFISGHTADSLYKQYLPEDGVILFKPILPSEFLRKIREMLQG